MPVKTIKSSRHRFQCQACKYFATIVNIECADIADIYLGCTAADMNIVVWIREYEEMYEFPPVATNDIPEQVAKFLETELDQTGWYQPYNDE